MPYQESIVIRRPVAEVFSYMNDIEREPEWQPNLREVGQTPPGAPGVGTIRRYVSEFMGRRFVNVYVNTVYEADRRVAYRSQPESDLQAEGEIRWEEVPDGTQVTMQVEPQTDGLLRLMPRRMREAMFSKELEATLARVKARLESSRG